MRVWFDGDMTVVQMRRRLLGPPRKTLWRKVLELLIRNWKGRV